MAAQTTPRAKWARSMLFFLVLFLSGNDDSGDFFVRAGRGRAVRTRRGKSEEQTENNEEVWTRRGLNEGEIVQKQTRSIPPNTLMSILGTDATAVLGDTEEDLSKWETYTEMEWQEFYSVEGMLYTSGEETIEAVGITPTTEVIETTTTSTTPAPQGLSPVGEDSTTSTTPIPEGMIESAPIVGVEQVAMASASELTEESGISAEPIGIDTTPGSAGDHEKDRPIIACISTSGITGLERLDTMSYVFYGVNLMNETATGVDPEEDVRRRLANDQPSAAFPVPLITISNTEESTCAYGLTKPSIAEQASAQVPDMEILPLASLFKVRPLCISSVTEDRVYSVNVDVAVWDGANPFELQEIIHQCEQIVFEDMVDEGGRRRLRERGSTRLQEDPYALWRRDSAGERKQEEEPSGRTNGSKDTRKLRDKAGRKPDRKLQEYWPDASLSLEGVEGGGDVDAPPYFPMSTEEICREVAKNRLNFIPHSDGMTFSLEITVDEEIPHDSNSTVPENQESFLYTKESIPPDCMIQVLYSLSKHAQVVSIDIASPLEELNLEVQKIVDGGDNMDRPAHRAGLTGAGEVVAMSDSGLDLNNCYFRDAAGNVPKNGSVNLSKRKVVAYKPYRDDREGRGKNGDGGHGTHVAGTILGSRGGSNGGLAEGMAPGAKLAVFDIADDSNLDAPSCCFVPAEFSLFLDEGKAATAKIHNCSWGSKNPNYLRYDAMFDDYVYRNVDHVIVVAGGNNGWDKDAQNRADDRVGSPANAKNVISVGVSQSHGPDLFPGMAGKHCMAWFSSAGKLVLPGGQRARIKPDLVSPGYYILSARSLPGFNPQDNCDPSDGIPPQPIATANNPYAYAKDGIAYKAGSSMSAPSVSGAAALVREYFKKGYHPTGAPSGNGFNPSAALVKAVLLNGAQPLSCVQMQNYGIQTIAEYDNNQGFGRVNLGTSLALRGENSLSIRIRDRKFIRGGETKRYLVTNNKNGCNVNEFRATLVYSDVAGPAGCVDCLMNDLDLSVKRTSSTRVYYPNGKSGPDRVNNAERVRIATGGFATSETLEVKVFAHNLITASQQYALVVTGCNLVLQEA